MYHEHFTEKNLNIKDPPGDTGACGGQDAGSAVRSQPTGDRAGYGCDPCFHAGDPFYNQGICIAAG